MLPECVVDWDAGVECQLPVASHGTVGIGHGGRGAELVRGAEVVRSVDAQHSSESIEVESVVVN